MSLYKELKQYGELFHSIRFHQGLMLLDLKLPTKWKVKEILSSIGSGTQIKINDSNEKYQLISFYTPFDEESVNNLNSDVGKVIKYNLDIEEKNKLLNIKILELKKLFDSNEVDKLRNINFEFGFNDSKLNVDDYETYGSGEGTEMVREGEEEGHSGN
jgi:hypothetical protein